MDARFAALYDQAKSQAIRELADWLSDRFRQEFNEKDWPFPTPPQMRDIVDSGKLRDSEQHNVAPDGTITFRWTAPYASQVHEGGVGLDGQRFPGRPWTRDPIAETPAKFAELLAKRLGGTQ